MDAGFEFRNLAGFKMFSMVDVDSMAAFFLGHLGHQRHGNIPRKLDHFKSGLPGLWAGVSFESNQRTIRQ